VPAKCPEIAKSVAAMANDGGVITFGRQAGSLLLWSATVR
jgi:hypothetical protein